MILLDQATKVWVVEILQLPALRQISLLPFFDLTYVENRGASFGMLAGGMGSRIILSIVAIGISLFLVQWLASIRRPLTAAGVAFVIGGAIGNLIDRVLYGYVIDFLDFSGLWFPWVFNVADSCINVGVACILVDAFREAKQQAQNVKMEIYEPGLAIEPIVHMRRSVSELILL